MVTGTRGWGGGAGVGSEGWRVGESASPAQNGEGRRGGGKGQGRGGAHGHDLPLLLSLLETKQRPSLFGFFSLGFFF